MERSVTIPNWLPSPTDMDHWWHPRLHQDPLDLVRSYMLGMTRSTYEVLELSCQSHLLQHWLGGSLSWIKSSLPGSKLKMQQRMLSTTFSKRNLSASLIRTSSYWSVTITTSSMANALASRLPLAPMDQATKQTTFVQRCDSCALEISAFNISGDPRWHGDHLVNEIHYIGKC